MLAVLADLGVTLPLAAAPMAGGPTTPELVVAAAAAGGIGFLAGGYKTADDLAAQLRAVRARTGTFAVNLFAPNPVPVDRARYARYRDRLRPLADRLGGVRLPADPLEDDDDWADKIELLAGDPAPVVSFTFGLPPPAVLAALRAAGSRLLQSVTSVDEAVAAADAGVDALVVQGWGAGGHSATWTPAAPPVPQGLADLVARISARVDLPIMAAGGLDTPQAVTTAMRAGAGAAAVGTALLLAPEAGTSTPHRGALTGPDRGPTVVTRSFSGRPARGLRNAFVDAHDQGAPVGYPAVHHLTAPLRRAAAAAGDAEHISLWAGTGYRSAVARPVGATLEALAVGL